MAKDKPKRARKSQPRPRREVSRSDAEIAQQVDANRQRNATIRTGIIGGCLLASPLPLWPVVEALAGKDTIVDVSVAVTLTAALTVTTGGAALWGRQHKKKGDEARGRVRDLESQVMTLQDENAALTRRNEEVSQDLAGVRADLTRLRPPRR